MHRKLRESLSQPIRNELRDLTSDISWISACITLLCTIADMRYGLPTGTDWVALWSQASYIARPIPFCIQATS